MANKDVFIFAREWLTASIENEDFKPPKAKHWSKAAQTATLIAALKAALWPYKTDKPLTINDIADIARIAAGLLKTKPEYVRPLCQYFLFTKLTEPVFNILVAQLAGNAARYGKAPTPGLYSALAAETGWAYSVVTEVCLGDKPGFDLLKFKVVPGPAAGAYCFGRINHGALGLLSHALGCTLHQDKMYISLQNTKETVLCAAMILLRTGTPLFSVAAGTINHTLALDSIMALKANPAQKALNKALTVLRGELCPHAKANPCHQCDVGYDKCPRGCHPRTVNLPSALETVQMQIKGKNICPINQQEI